MTRIPKKEGFQNAVPAGPTGWGMGMGMKLSGGIEEGSRRDRGWIKLSAYLPTHPPSYCLLGRCGASVWLMGRPRSWSLDEPEHHQLTGRISQTFHVWDITEFEREPSAWHQLSSRPSLLLALLPLPLLPPSRLLITVQVELMK